VRAYPKVATIMSTRIETLRTKGRGFLDEATSIAQKAADAGRHMSATEQSSHDAAITAGRQVLEQLKQAKSDEAILGQAHTLAREIGSDDNGQPTNRGGAQVKSREWAAKTATKVLTAAQQHGVKALVTGSIDVANPISVGVVPMPTNPTRLTDLIVQREGLTGNAFSYLRQTVRTNNAAPVADLALKPTSVYTYAEIDDKAHVIAHLSQPIPERYLADHTQLEELLSSEMFNGVLNAVETQVISGSGVGENVTGILTAAGTTQVPWTTDIFTTLRKARTALQVKQEVPTAWAFSLADAESLDLAKDANGQFYGDQPTIFGNIPKVFAAGIPAGFAILADWTQCKLFVREDVKLDADRSGSNFTSNAVVLRAEGRYGFGVLRPQAFAIVDLTA
jgi:HK97 family phage major capsid protein